MIEIWSYTYRLNEQRSSFSKRKILDALCGSFLATDTI